MTDVDLVAKRLAIIETCVQELRTLARPERIGHDVREDRFVERTLQIAVQAAIDVASHIVSDERLGEPRTNRELFDLLERNGWLGGELAARCCAGWRASGTSWSTATRPWTRASSGTCWNIDWSISWPTWRPCGRG